MPSKGSSGGGSTNTVTQQSQPPAQFQQGLSTALQSAQGAASTPYQNYPGQLQAGFSPQQQQGFGLVGSTPGIAAPYINAAAQHMDAATTPLWSNLPQYSGSAVNGYMNPYVGDVVNTTQAQFNNQNAQAANRLQGNAASAGALGGDRAGVAQAVLQGQEDLAQAPVIAGLYNTGFGQAQQEFNQQQGAQLGANEANAWLNSQAGAGFGSLGNEALGTTLQSANALLGTGGMQQQQAQQALNIPYEQWVAQQAYPFQTSGWLSGTTGQLANAAGGTASTTSPGANPWSQAGGLALGATGLVGATGGFGSNGWLTGANGIFSSSGLPSATALAGLSGAADAALAGGVADAGIGAGSAALGALGFIKRGGAIKPHRAAGGMVPQIPTITGFPGQSVSVSSAPSSVTGFALPQINVTQDSGSSDPVSAYLAQVKAGAFTPQIGPQIFPGQIGAPSSPVVNAPSVDTGAVPTVPDQITFGSDNEGGGGGGRAHGGSIRGFAAGGAPDISLSGMSDIPQPGASVEPAFNYEGNGDPEVDDTYVHMPVRGGFGAPAVDDSPPHQMAAASAPLPIRDTGEPMPMPRHGFGASDIAPRPAGANPWLALADAGFGMAAGKSPHALENIGAGAQQGVKEFVSADTAAKNLAARVDEARARLAEAQSWHEGTLGTRQYGIKTRADSAANSQDVRLQIANMVDARKARGESDADAHRHVMEEIAAGHLDVAQQNSTTMANRADTAKDLSQQRIAQTAQRIQQSAEGQLARQALSARNLDQQTQNNIMNNATRMVASDLTGKMTLARALQLQLGARDNLPAPAAPAAAPLPAAGNRPPLSAIFGQ